LTTVFFEVENFLTSITGHRKVKKVQGDALRGAEGYPSQSILKLRIKRHEKL
jgi:hypothetical protein